MSKVQTIKLAHKRESTESLRYLVLVVKNSTAYAPGQWLSQRETDTLCRSSQWDVTVVSFDEQRRVN